MRHNLVYGRAFLLLTLGLCIALISVFGVGCGKSDGSKQAATTKAREIAILVYVDRSQSIEGYPGGLKAIQSVYGEIGQRYSKAILTKRDGVEYQICDFVQNKQSLYGPRKIDKWEQVSKTFYSVVRAKPYPAGEQSKTMFSTLIDDIRIHCKENQGKDYFVVVLSDGHPDDSYGQIKESADAFAKDKLTNLKSLLVAPVQPDMQKLWRDKLQDALSPIGDSVIVGNNSDYKGATDRIKEMMKEGTN